MKRLVIVGLVILLTGTNLSAQSEAGAIFLLIPPGARAGGMGETQVAVADDAYASYWNPAGLGFLNGSQLALMHVNWLPNLADDLYYDFLAYRHHVPHLGTLGGHLIYLGLGEQIRTDESGTQLGTFTSYMVAAAMSYSSLFSRTSSLGINVKVSYQHLAEYGAGAEKGKGTSTDFGFDIGYLKKEFLIPKLKFGLTVTNIGPKVDFIDPAQGDPQPTNLTLGFNYRIIDSPYNKLNLMYDVHKLLVASYPDMDWDGDGIIGGYDKDGHTTLNNPDYNKNSQKEAAHTDPIYIAIFTSWVDDWLIGGDIDRDGDRKIGGFDKEGNPTDSVNYGDPGWGKYGWDDQNEKPLLEVGSADERTIMDEIDRLIHNVGFEYWYSSYFAIRGGYLYDKTGKIYNPTFGVGLRFSDYGFDFGYTSGPPGHPLTNTMRFSLEWKF